MNDAVVERLATERPALLKRLDTLLRCQSVSTDPAYAQGMKAARAFWRERLTAAGFAKLQTLEAGGHPALYAEWSGAQGEDKPTFLVYGHYDVQPPDPLEKWDSPPFEPTLRDGRLYARGVSDDKAPSLIAIEALAAFLAVEGELPVNVKILLEGEEELGSATLGALIRRHRGLLAADAVLSADGARWRVDLPTVNAGARGMTGFEATLTTAAKDLHSGRYGGAAPNALHAVAALIASLHDAQGGIAVAGFLDGVAPLTKAERAALAAIPFDERAFFAEINAAEHGEAAYTILERLWYRPSIEVNGLWGGYTGAGSKTVIPCEAQAKLTMRLVPGQDPCQARQAVIEHLRQHCPPGARLAIGDEIEGCAAYTVPPAHPLLAAAEDAIGATLGRRPLRVRIGSTLPLSEIVARELGIDTVMFSFSTADEDFHAPNEFFRLRSFDEGFEAWVCLLRILGRQRRQDYAMFSGSHIQVDNIL